MNPEVPTSERGRYVNPHIPDVRRKPRDFLLWLLGIFRDIPYEIVPEGFTYPLPNEALDEKMPWAMWIGHSSYLLSVGGKHFLTDPIWSNRCSPVRFMGPRRKSPPPLEIEELPQIDYVLISHDHYDHLDRPSVERLHARFPNILWVVPKGVKIWFQRLGIQQVIELSWWEAINVNSSIRITAVPAQHFSGRSTPDLNKTLWAGFVVEELLVGRVFYFVGDTGYNGHDFVEIGRQFPNIDLSLIPIGSYSPRKFMAPVHVEPKDAVKIHQDVASKRSLAMHWRTFKLSEEPMEQPPFDLFHAMRGARLDPAAFLAIDPGRKINW
jgi:N-acyl-phosphatidylethanolamine-hydrolysing phospholipase D